MLTRRTFLEGLTAVQGTAWLERIRRPDASMSATPARTQSASSGEGPYPAEWLPAGVRSRLLANINGIALHVLEAGYETSGRPLLLLRGAISDLLTPETVAGMRERAPQLVVVEVPDRGHAPTLDEPASRAAVEAFLASQP